MRIDIKEIIHDAVTVGNMLVLMDKKEGIITFYPSTLPRLTEAIAHWINANIEQKEKKNEGDDNTMRKS